MKTQWWLRIEGAFELALALCLYARMGSSWLLFALLFLTPDLSMLGYLRGPRIGAWCYNALHNYVAAIALALTGMMLGKPIVVALALIWCAHISFDRMLGYGLKSPESFQATHLGIIGRPAKIAATDRS